MNWFVNNALSLYAHDELHFARWHACRYGVITQVRAQAGESRHGGALITIVAARQEGSGMPRGCRHSVGLQR